MADPVAVTRTVPVLRIFDEAKAREFYVDFLGFDIAFEYRADPDQPIYMGIYLAGAELHLSEHHGDGAPGAFVRLEVDDLDGLHQRLNEKDYRHARPAIEEQPWGFRELKVYDPFGNRLVFCKGDQSIEDARAGR